jgi:aryl-alcohol dehydrogenase-like predicted oxidoreductase
VLAQPFPVVPLIGPRTLRELDDSLEALDIRLAPEQVRWLEGPRREETAAPAHRRAERSAAG